VQTQHVRNIIMTEIDHGYREPTNPNQPETPRTGSEGVADAHDIQDTDLSQEIPKDVILPGSESLTPQQALGNIHPAEQANAEGLVAASRVETEPDSWTDRLKKSRVARSIGKAVALATVAAVAVGITKAMGDDNSNPAPTPQVTNSAPATTGPSEATSAPTTEAPTVAPSTTETVNTPGAAEAVLLAEMETQSPEAFANRDIHEQQIYVRSKYAIQADKAVMNYWLDQKLTDGTIVYNNNPALKEEKLNQFADGDEIAAESAFRKVLPGAWKIDPEVDPTNEENAQKKQFPLDQSTAEKLASGAYLPGSPAWVSFIDTLKHSEYAGGKKDSEVGFIVDNTSPLQDVGAEYKGETLKGKILQIRANGQTYLETHVFLDDGTGTGGDWLLYRVAKKPAQ
jgi:hypothetical protein